MSIPTITAADVDAAAEAIRGAVIETPCTQSQTISEIVGRDVWCKFENLQYTASFKERGALNFLLGISETDRSTGVVAASAGNHAQGVAHHAARLGVRATIVMPETTPFVKIERTEVLGARIVLHGRDFGEALAHAERLAEQEHATFVPAFDHPRIIAGQGTVGPEILDAVPELAAIVVPCGGGGLLAGVAVAVKARRPEVLVIGVQSEHMPAMAAALGYEPHRVEGTTIAEGVAVREPGTLTRAIAGALVDDMVTVTDDSIEQAIALLLEVEKTVVEGAGALGLAALRQHPELARSGRVAVILSGGNLDPRNLSSIIIRSLTRSGRLVSIRVTVPDVPGALGRLTALIGDAGANILEIEHRRDILGIPLRATQLSITLEVRDAEHSARATAQMTQAGYRVEAIND